MLTKKSLIKQGSAFLLILVLCFPLLGESKPFHFTTKTAVNFIQEDDDIYLYVDKNPQYPGGNAALNKYLNNNLKYPAKARKKNQQGIVKVYFVVRKDGSIDRVRVIKSAGSLLDAEAIRLVKSMPRWKPGYNHGRAVNVQQSLPIAFHFSYSSYYVED